jgi:hypothetical protein
MLNREELFAILYVALYLEILLGDLEGIHDTIFLGSDQLGPSIGMIGLMPILVVLTKALCWSPIKLVASIDADDFRSTLTDISKVVAVVSRSASGGGISDVFMSFVRHDVQARRCMFKLSSKVMVMVSLVLGEVWC